MTTFTIREIAAAMEADTTPKGHAALLKDGARCAIGGAAYVLGIDDVDLWLALRKVPPCDALKSPHGFVSPRSLAFQITALNDHTDLSKPEIGAMLRESACDAVVSL